MVKTGLFYDFIVGKDFVSPTLKKIAEQNKAVTDKFKGFTSTAKSGFKSTGGAASTFKSKLSGIKSKANNLFDGMANNGRVAFQEISNKFSQFKSRFGSIGNPFTAAITGATALVSGIAIASEAAARFENQFRAIANINQDKSVAELTRLKQQLNDFSYIKGVDNSQVLTAYYDLQSATGQYGDNAIAILSKVSDFSKATQGNFIDNINASSKAMVQFGFGVNELDGYLKSNAKTVKLGITTFEQLGKAQPEFLGSALKAGQGIDQANKLFAAMTSAAKSTDIAATLTKGAFEGLSNPTVTKALEKQGVTIFNNKGKMLGLEQITKNTYKAIKNLSDKDFQKFAGNVGGNEGFKAFLSKVKGSGVELQKMFDKFNNTDFDIDLALQLAKNDPIELRKSIAAKFKGLTTKIGLAFNLKGLQTSILKKVESGLDFIHRVGILIGNLKIGEKLGKGFGYVKSKALGLTNSIYGVANSIYGFFYQNYQGSLLQKALGLVFQLAEKIKQLNIGEKIGKAINFIQQQFSRLYPVFDFVKEKAVQLGGVFYGYLNGAWQLFKNNLDVIEPFLYAFGIGLVAINAQAVFSAAVAIPKMIASLAFATAQFFLGNIAMIAYYSALTIGKGIMLAAAGVAKIFTLGQWALNAALTANPIGLLIAGLALAAAGLYAAYQKSAKFRAAIAGISAVVKNAMPIFYGLGKVIEGIFTGDFSKIKEGFNDVIEGFRNFNPFSSFKDGVYGQVEMEVKTKRAKEAAEKENQGKPKTETPSLLNGITGLLPEMPNIGIDSFIKLPELPKIPDVPTVDIPTNLNTPTINGQNPSSPILASQTINPQTVGGVQTNETNVNYSGDNMPTKGAKIVKNISLTIDKLIGNITLSNGDLSADLEELEERLLETIIKAVKGAEIELGLNG